MCIFPSKWPIVTCVVLKFQQPKSGLRRARGIPSSQLGSYKLRLSGVICSLRLPELKTAMIHSSPVDADNLHSRMMRREKQELRLVPCVKSLLQTSILLFVCQRLSIYLLFSIYPINNATSSDSIFQIDALQKVPVSKFEPRTIPCFPHL
jgi:hypothetical protein